MTSDTIAAHLLVGVVPGTTSREVLGLMMAGVPPQEALASASVTTQREEDAALASSTTRPDPQESR